LWTLMGAEREREQMDTELSNALLSAQKMATALLEGTDLTDTELVVARQWFGKAVPLGVEGKWESGALTPRDRMRFLVDLDAAVSALVRSRVVIPAEAIEEAMRRLRATKIDFS